MEVGFDILSSLGVGRIEPAFIKGYVEFDESDFLPPAATRLASSIRARGLEVQALSAHMDLSTAGADDALARRIDCAATLGARVLITNAGPGAHRSNIMRCLERAVPRLEAAGICLALENPGHGSGDLIGTAKQAVELIDAIGSGHVRLNVDVGNFATYLGGIDPMPSIEEAVSRAVHVHLKDYTCAGEDWRFSALGDGELDFQRILAVTGSLPVGIELPLRLIRPDRGDPIRSEIRPLDDIRAALVRSLAVVHGHATASDPAP